jgi:hypothetical protein
LNAPTRRLRMIGFPCELYVRSRRRNEALLREFAFLMQSDADTDTDADTPSRLVTIGREIENRFYGLNSTLEDEVEAALARGEDSIDLEVTVLSIAREAAETLGELFDEADAYCRRGDLLTLEEPPELRAFRQWYLEQCVRQLDGEAPSSWPEWQARRANARS